MMASKFAEERGYTTVAAYLREREAEAQAA
jgi:hypothetical protein